MGIFSTKPATETKVYTPLTPVNISPGLLSQLVSTKETDFTREQLNEKYIEEKVSQRYAKLEEETLKKFELKLDNALLGDGPVSEKELSSARVNEKVASLKGTLEKLEERTNPKVTKEVVDIKESLKQCLISNKDKPLNCYEEIKKFKELAM